MDPKYLTGIEEIDDQHREIEETALAVIEAAATKDKWHIVHYILVRLYELLRFHFAVEESVMSIVGFPEVGEHKQVHNADRRAHEGGELGSQGLRARRGLEQAVQLPDAHCRPRQALHRVRDGQLPQGAALRRWWWRGKAPRNCFRACAS
jgi:hypothetical protein